MGWSVSFNCFLMKNVSSSASKLLVPSYVCEICEIILNLISAWCPDGHGSCGQSKTFVRNRDFLVYPSTSEKLLWTDSTQVHVCGHSTAWWGTCRKRFHSGEGDHGSKSCSKRSEKETCTSTTTAKSGSCYRRNKSKRQWFWRKRYGKTG